MPDHGPVAANAGKEGGHLSDALARFAATIDKERVDLGAIIHVMGRRSIGALLLVFALPMALPVPAPGVSVIFGVPLVLISAQLLLGRRHAWLPARLVRRSVSRADFVAFVDRALPTLRVLERVVRARVNWMAGDWTTVPVGAICLLLAIIITLPIPLGHMVPGAAISVLALGLIEHDGLAIGLGVLTAILALTIVTVASSSLVGFLGASFSQ
jgi:hypothetical protein